MSGKRILLCEDNHLLRNSLVTCLELLGCFVVDVATADGALELGMEALREFDVLLTDIEMPGTNGIELANLLNFQSPQLTIILMSGHSIHPDEIRHLGGHFFQKPVKFSELEATIQSSVKQLELPARPGIG